MLSVRLRRSWFEGLMALGSYLCALYEFVSTGGTEMVGVLYLILGALWHLEANRQLEKDNA
jgi:hypothetical protein